MAQKVSDWENAKERYPSVKHGVEEWMDFFDRRPDVMHQILGDIYVVTKYDERKRETGKRLDGRRTMPKDANLPELWNMITPQFCMEPFPVAFNELQGGRSLRAMAARTGIDHRRLSDYIDGRRPMDLFILDKIATGCRVNPAFFLEYRVLLVQQILGEIMTERPNLSIGVVKRLMGQKPA